VIIEFNGTVLLDSPKKHRQKCKEMKKVKVNEIKFYGEIENQSVLKRLEILLSGIRSKFTFPGILIGIFFDDGSKILITSGYADILIKRLISPSDHFRIASVTKTFIATLTMLLSEEGKLELDTQVSELLTIGDYFHGISVRHLLNHTSGLFNYFDDKYFQETIHKSPARIWKPHELVTIGTSHEPYCKPGKSYNYSNTNYIILGLLIESVTGNKLRIELEKRILNPLGLSGTYFPENDPSLPEHHIKGYVLSPESGDYVDHTFLNPSFSWAAGGMVSNVYDMCRWALALGRGELLSDRSRSEMLTCVDASSGGVPFAQYGAGITKIGNFIGHEGELLGYNTAVYGHIEGKFSIAVVVNRFFGKPSVAGETFIYLAKSLSPKDIPF